MPSTLLTRLGPYEINTDFGGLIPEDCFRLAENKLAMAVQEMHEEYRKGSTQTLRTSMETVDTSGSRGQKNGRRF